MNLQRFLLSSLLCLLPLTFVKAGTADARDFSATTTSSEVKEDIGDIHPENQGGFMSHFRSSASVQGQYTTNALMTGYHGSSDFVTNPMLEAGYNQPLGHGFALDVSGKFQSVIYSRFGGHGIWGFDGAANLDYRYRTTWPRVYVGVEPYYYAFFDSGNTAAEALALTTGVDQDWTVNKGRTILSMGYAYTHHFASPAIDDRSTNAVVFGVTHQFKPALFGQVYYSYQFTDYLEASRNDSRNLVAFNLIYQFSKGLFGTFNTTFVDNRSTVGAASYQMFNVGFGVTYQF